MLQDIPEQMRQSKLLPAETLFADLCLARRDNSATASTSSQTKFACMHSSPCLAPHGTHTSAYWLLAAIDEACSVIPTETSFRMLDLARTDSGALEYALSRAPCLKDPGHVIALDSQAARHLQEQGNPVALWNAWAFKKAAPFSTGSSSWQLRMLDQPLVDLVVGVVSHSEVSAVLGMPAPNEHSTAYRSELLWRCAAALTSLAAGKEL